MMRTKFRAQISVLLLAGLLTGPFAVADDEEKEDTADDAAAKKICINSHQVRSFDPLSDRYVFIEAGSKNYYLLTMANRCPGLKYSNVIAFKDTTSRICANGFSDIVYRDMGRTQSSCRIGPIEKVADKEEAKALVAEREAPSN